LVGSSVVEKVDATAVWLVVEKVVWSVDDLVDASVDLWGWWEWKMVVWSVDDLADASVDRLGWLVD